MFGDGLGDVLVNGEEGFAGTPVHLADELAAKGVDDTGDGGVLRLQMKSKSSIPWTALGCIPLLKSVLTSDPLGYFVLVDLLYEASCLVVEESVREGESTRLGGLKRVMLSLADCKPLAVLARGADSGMMAIRNRR